MERFQDAYLPLLVWLAFIGFIFFCAQMYRWAKKQKGRSIGIRDVCTDVFARPQSTPNYRVGCGIEAGREREKG